MLFRSIISLLYKSTPDEVRFIMVDPKMVELAPYNGIPHLLIPVVTDPKKAAGALQWAVFEMMKRYKTFSENGVKKLEEYNKLAAVREDLEKLPSVVVVIDELADLMPVIIIVLLEIIHIQYLNSKIVTTFMSMRKHLIQIGRAHV